jgi:hypothetical protein
VACERFFVVDLETAGVQSFSNCIQAYHTREYRKMLREFGFEGVKVYPSLGGTPVNGKWLAITGENGSDS